MWQKTRTLLAYMYINYYNDYDWFHVGGDDMWLIVENLRAYVDSPEIQLAANGGMQRSTSSSKKQKRQTPLFMGEQLAVKPGAKELFAAGGSGYTLNKAALKLFMTKGQHFKQDRAASAEDLFISQAFAEHGVYVYPTHDQANGERYHHLTPGMYIDDKIPKHWYAVYTKLIPHNLGINRSSVHSVSFHMVKASLMYRLHALLYGFCDSK